jgi:nucleotide-binding universal stress UspA family protein
MKGDKAKEEIFIPAIEKILVPVDRTPLSMKAANYGIHLAELEKAKELIVMHVVEDIKQAGAIGLRAKYGDVKMIEGFRKAKVGSAEEMIKPIEEEAKKKGVNIRSEIVYAEGKSIVKSITEYANKNHIDLIVIGGGDVSQRMFLIVGGSVAMGVIKKSQCPVVVVR